MKQEYISTGKNVEVAIKEGLLTIGKEREDVDIKILETGGLFKKAKVILIYEEELKQEEPVVEQVSENISTSEQLNEIPSTVCEKEENTQTIETKQETVEEDTPICQDNSQEIIESADNVEKREDVLKDEISTIKEENIKVVDSADLIKRVSEFLVDLAKQFGVEAQVGCTQTENDLNFTLTGEKVGALIGYRGETLSAIQFLLSNLKKSGEGRYRIYLDIEGYKAKREQTLIELANKMADKAEEIERNVHLDPMTAYERRIIHTALQNREKVETESMGEGVKRHLVIKFKR